MQSMNIHDWADRERALTEARLGEVGKIIPQGGKMTEVADIDRVIHERSIWGKGYANQRLENKRRRAILWLRNGSKRGWCMDGCIDKAKPQQ